MQKYYTIFLGKKIYEDVIDDMNTTEIWAFGGMVWKNKSKALACIKNLKSYNFETKNKVFSVKELIIK